jgi:diguanylate cyclase (GGDEF)-like protein
MLSADSSKEESLGTMRRIVSELSRSPVRWVTDDGNPHEIAVTLSIGIAESADKAELVSMLKAADDAAYRSKANGRNQITVAD